MSKKGQKTGIQRQRTRQIKQRYGHDGETCFVTVKRDGRILRRRKDEPAELVGYCDEQ